MGNVTVRVPEELKTRMKLCKSVNWSEVARKLLKMPHVKKRYNALHRQSRTFDWQVKLNGTAPRQYEIGKTP